MDIQVSSNFERLLFEASAATRQAVRRLMQRLAADPAASTSTHAALAAIRADFAAGRADEAETAATMRDVHAATGYLPDPHTAVGLAVSRRFADPAVPMVTLATAHPAKFPAAVEAATGIEPALPAGLADITGKRERLRSSPTTWRRSRIIIAAPSRATAERV